MNTETTKQIDPSAATAPSGQDWAYAVRTCGPGGEAYSGFRWPLEVGAVVHAPDFDPTPACGRGLHLNPWGMGDWSLHRDDDAAIWMIVRYDPALAVDLDGGELGGKIKAPWAIVEQVATRANVAHLLARIAALRTNRLKAITKEALTSGYSAHAATSGYSAHAATSGYSAHAATSGDSAHAATSGYSAHAATSGYSAHAATSGYRAHAATSGYSAHAATSGDRAHAATSGDRAHAATSGYSAHAATTGEAAIASALGWAGRAQASVGGAIVLAEYKWDADAGKATLIAVFASKVGENGIEPDTLYELKYGKPVVVTP